MIHILVVDDEEKMRHLLSIMLERKGYQVDQAGDGIEAFEMIRETAYDIVICDIKMPNLSGIQFLKSLTNQPLVIFTTAYSDYAVESYDYQVIDYLLKPIEFDRFLKAANKAQKQHNLLLSQGTRIPPSGKKFRQEGKDLLILKSGTDFHPIQADKILYVEGAGNYVFFYTGEKKVMALMTLKDALKKLPAQQFLRIHKSYIVNFRKIDVIETDQVKIGETNIPIGETYKKEFLTKIKA